MLRRVSLKQEGYVPSELSSKVNDVRLERIRANWEAMGGTDELEVKG